MRAKMSAGEILARGNPSRLSRSEILRRAKDENAPDIVASRPRIPKHLSPEAITAWREAVRLLRKKGTLSSTDSAVLEVYSEVKATWIAAKADVLSRGTLLTETRFSKAGNEYTVEIVNPNVKIKADSEKQMLSLTRSLGLAPDAREKVRRVSQKKKKSELAPGSAAALYPEFFQKGKVC